MEHPGAGSDAGDAIASGPARGGRRRLAVVASCVVAVVALVVVVALVRRGGDDPSPATTTSAPGSSSSVTTAPPTSPVTSTGTTSTTAAPATSVVPGATDPVPAVALPAGTARVVALGDSYSAGEGVEPFESDAVDVAAGGDGCHRSPKAYGRLLAAAVRPAPQVVFSACSGAKIDNVFVTAQRTGSGVTNRFGVQAAPGVLGRDVGLVTLTLGGNDADFSRVVLHCFTNAACLDAPFTDDAGATATSLRAWADAFLATLGARLDPVYARLRADAPEARIVVLGYPHLFPEGLGDTATPVCALLGLVDAGEQRGVNELTDRLDRVIEQRARANGLEYVDTTELWRGHEACGARGGWTAFLSSLPVARPAGAGVFHPTEVGQRQLARAVACHLAQYPTATAAARRPEGDTSPPVCPAG